MARKRRKASEKKIYHIILRGNNKQNLFYNDNDRILFMDRLRKYSDELFVEVYAYCMMDNHVHILLGNVTMHDLSLFVQKLANSYVYHFNYKYDCTGHLFQGRFKSEPIETDSYFKNVLRYIIHNPEKSGITKYKNYDWSSYKDLVNKKCCTFVKVDYVRNLFTSFKTMKRFIDIRDDMEEYMEFENKKLLTDSKAIQLLKSIFKINNPYSLNKLDISEQANIFTKLRNLKMSKQQISRITGIRYNYIRFYM